MGRDFLLGVVSCPKRGSREQRATLIVQHDFVRDDEACGKCMACVCEGGASCNFVLVRMCRRKEICPARN